MDFSFTEEQGLLRDSVAAYLADTYDFDKRRAAIASPDGWRPEVWKAFANDLGILGASFPEDLGGLGGAATDVMVVMEEFGKALVVEPYLGTVVIGGGFLTHGKHAAAEDLVGKIISGDATFAFAWAEPQGRYTVNDLKTTARKDGEGYVLNGAKAVVIGAPWASHLIVTARTGGAQRETGGVSVFLVEKSAPGVSTRDYPTVDGRRASEVTFDNVKLGADALIGPGRRGTASDRPGHGRGRRRHLRRGLRRAAPPARRHTRLHAGAQAVRRPDRQLPGPAAPHGRHVHPARTGDLHDLHGPHQADRLAPTNAPRASPRPRSRSAAPAVSSARTPSSSTAAWA